MACWEGLSQDKESNAARGHHARGAMPRPAVRASRRSRPAYIAYSSTNVRALYVLELGGVRVLLEARQLAAAELQHVADLSIETLACLLIDPGVASFDDDHRTRIMELRGMHSEAIPFRSELHEQVLQDRLRPQPGLAVGLVRVPLCFAPFDVGVHHLKHGGNITPAEGIVYTSR